MSKQKKGKSSAQELPNDKKDSVLITVQENSRDSSNKKILNASLDDAIVNSSDDEQIYNSCDVSMLEDTKDEAAEYLMRSLKRQLQNLDSAGKTRNDAEILNKQRKKERKTFTSYYVKKNTKHYEINNFFADELMTDDLMNPETVKLKSMMQKRFEVVTTDILNSDKYNGFNIPTKKLNLNQAIPYLKNGYEEDIKSGLNENNDNYYVLKYERDECDPDIQKEMKVKDQIAKAEAQRMIHKIYDDKEKRDQEYIERKKRLESAESRQRKKEKKKKKVEEQIEVSKADQAKERIALANDFYKEKRSYLAEFEEKYNKKYLDDKVPLYKKKKNAHKKGSNKQVQEALDKIHDDHKPVRREDLEKHQEYIETLKTKLKNDKDTKKDTNKTMMYPIPMTQKLEFYNNIDMRKHGNDVATTFITPSIQKEEQNVDVNEIEEQIKKEFEENEQNGFDSTKKQEKLDSILGKSRVMYLHYKKKYFAQKRTEKNIKKDYDINTKKIYEGLPGIEKELAKKEYKEKIDARIERNKSLPSLYLEAGKKLGRQNLEKQNLNDNSEGQPSLKSGKIKNMDPPKKPSKNSEQYPNYLKTLNLNRNLFNDKVNSRYMKEKFEDLNMQGLEKLMAEVNSMDQKNNFKQISNKYGVKPIQNINDCNSPQIGTDRVSKSETNLLKGKKQPSSVYSQSLRAKVEILNYLIEDDENEDKCRTKNTNYEASTVSYNIKKSNKNYKSGDATKPNMVADLLNGKQLGSNIIDNYIEKFEKEKEYEKKMQDQKKQCEKLKETIKEERQKLKVNTIQQKSPREDLKNTNKVEPEKKDISETNQQQPEKKEITELSQVDTKKASKKVSRSNTRKGSKKMSRQQSVKKEDA